ncbi:MAG TPA: hypothetical protein VLF63_02605 [Patescibacteria group bacterium]|nr:hypothetical protein [Patescibacteria group bacterium]
MAASDKDTIYIDIDDEITGIIDKVKGSKNKVVALVLPKRASVFQSIVNMKLLKKAGDSGSKNIVLITAEAGLLPLAGSAGIHVAKTLTSKPEIPAAPIPFKDNNEAFDEDANVPTFDQDELDQTRTIGQLASAEVFSPASEDGVETVALDNTEPKDTDKPDDKAKAPKDKSKKNKKLKVPNFEKFRKYLLIGGAALIALILLILIFSSAFAKATINISTNGTNIDTNLNLNLSNQAKTLEISSSTIPSKQDQIQKTFSQQVGTTGQKNNGNKASGSISNVSGGSCSATPPGDIPVGSGASSNGLTYITQDAITFQPVLSGGHCTFQGQDSSNGHSNIPIIAQSGGASFNVSGAPFTISGYSASGSASGGTDNIIQVVNQNDINNAKSKISASDSGIKTDLVNQLKGEGYFSITATYNVGTPSVTTSANVGDQASNVTVTETINYTMFGVHESDLKALVDHSVDGQIDTSKQGVLSEGLSKAVFNPNTLTATGGQVTMSTVAEAGPKLDLNSIKKSIAGHKAGEIKTMLNSYPGVTDVKVKISPFWSTNAPKNTSKININIAKPKTTKQST